MAMRRYEAVMGYGLPWTRRTVHEPDRRRTEIVLTEDIYELMQRRCAGFDEGKSTFDGKFDEEEISTFAKTSSIPLIGEVGPETYASYTTSLSSLPSVSRSSGVSANM